MLKFSCILANGHIMLNTPVLVRSLKLSNIEPSQYLDGWPPGNTGCCWLFFFSYFKRIFAFFGKTIKKFRFSRGFVGFDKSFWVFREVLRGFEVSRFGTWGIDRTLTFSAKVCAQNSKIHRKIVQKSPKSTENLWKFHVFEVKTTPAPPGGHLLMAKIITKSR